MVASISTLLGIEGNEGNFHDAYAYLTGIVLTELVIAWLVATEPQRQRASRLVLLTVANVSSREIVEYMSIKT